MRSPKAKASLQLVGDEDDGEAARRRAGASARRVPRRPCGVSMEVASSRISTRPPRISARTISDLLLLAERQRSGDRHRGSIEMPMRLAGRRRARAPASCGSGRRHQGPPSAMFSATVRLGTSITCWKTVPMPRSSARRGEVIARRLPVDADFAFVGLLQARQHADQRRLAGAVLAEQDMHLARPDREVDAVIGDDAGKALGHALELHDRGIGGSAAAATGSTDGARALERFRPARAGDVRPGSALAAGSLLRRRHQLVHCGRVEDGLDLDRAADDVVAQRHRPRPRRRPGSAASSAAARNRRRGRSCSSWCRTCRPSGPAIIAA